MNKRILEDYIKKEFSQYKMAELENCSQATIRRWFHKFNLKTIRRKHLNTFCQNCGNIYKGRGKKCCSRECAGILRKQKFIKGVTNGTIELDPEYGQGIRRYILAVREHRCVICKSLTWNSKPIPLIVDHVDGNYMNITFDNLRLICPNCDAQLPTYAGRNYGNGRHKRRERYKKGLSS
jgi:hypothetical protein